MSLEDEQAAFRDRKPSMLGRGVSGLTNPFSQAVANVVPRFLVEGVIKGIDRAAGLPVLVGFDHDRSDLEACRRQASRVERVAKAVSASTGAATGLGGILTMSLDIPATIAIAMRNIRTTGRAYGFDADNETERLFRLRILELAALDGSGERARRIAQLEAAIAADGDLHLTDSRDIEPLIDQAVERVSRAMAFAAFRSRAGMMVPLIGAAVGGIVNASFQGDISRAARYAYQARRLRTQRLASDPSTGARRFEEMGSKPLRA